MVRGLLGTFQATNLERRLRCHSCIIIFCVPQMAETDFHRYILISNTSQSFLNLGRSSKDRCACGPLACKKASNIVRVCQILRLGFRHDCIEIFPLGGLIYITDDVFEEKPQLALKIILLFLKRVEILRQLTRSVSPWEKVDDASVLWRLCVRPELMEFLLQYCENSANKLEAGDPNVKRLVDEICAFDRQNH